MIFTKIQNAFLAGILATNPLSSCCESSCCETEKATKARYARMVDDKMDYIPSLEYDET